MTRVLAVALHTVSGFFQWLGRCIDPNAAMERSDFPMTRASYPPPRLVPDLAPSPEEPDPVASDRRSTGGPS